MANIEFFTVSSLEKVLLDKKPVLLQDSYTKLKDEKFNFQVAMSADEPIQHAHFTFESDISKDITIKMVENVPVQLGCYVDCDDYILSDKSGVYPDILRDFEPRDVALRAKKWIACMVSVKSRKAGNHTIDFSLTNDDGEIMARCSYNLEILPEKLGDYDLIYTNWMHYDCIADLHHAKVFSKRFYKITERYIKSAVEHGMTMLLTPLFTPALDTYVGGERPTVQLVDVYLENGKYSFDFSRLDDFIQRAFSLGIKYIEFSHLFSQWGAKYAPKVVATVNGKKEKIFGWHTPAVGEYTKFLESFLPQLTAKLRKWEIADVTYFHISDEPREEHLESYKAAKESLGNMLDGFHTFDALSSYEFYRHGLIDKPVPGNNEIEEFLANGLTDMWTYYCTGQFYEVSNRFMSMPSARNRIYGVQLYKYKIIGVLHWGYNFYNSQYSIEHINPYEVTDAAGAFPSGDPFLVYPGENGQPEESLRMMVHDEAMTDLRALKLLESLTSREHVMELIEGNLPEPLTFKRYPKSDMYLIQLRDRVNREIKELTAERK